MKYLDRCLYQGFYTVVIAVALSPGLIFCVKYGWLIFFIWLGIVVLSFLLGGFVNWDDEDDEDYNYYYREIR